MNQPITKRKQGHSFPARVYKDYGRRCRSCKGQLCERIAGIGKLGEATVLMMEIFCPRNCPDPIKLTAREIAVAAKIKEVAR